ncbi:capsule biosynthesis protein CapG [Acinetobacter haemolyticus]|uniref:acyltransferase n=1 Tax=Acinetobacter haemolyticus TaxID=29430 RepID=UPI0013725571|nr:acyltransferase [Acinetobacter haemolyticus]NAR19382.1 capsule biosynthesis protein CapG [Acinetobacter haemolyticus]
MYFLKVLIIFFKKKFWSGEKYARSLGVVLGESCSISKSVGFGSEPYLIEIGDNVQLTDNVKFFNHGGGWVLRSKYPNFDFFGKIKIGNNVYVGSSSLILPGVTIGNNVLIGAGSVITKSIPSNCVVGGNPAKVLCMLDEFERNYVPFNLDIKGLSSFEKKDYLLNLEEKHFVRK